MTRSSRTALAVAALVLAGVATWPELASAEAPPALPRAATATAASCPNAAALVDAVAAELGTRVHAQILACVSNPHGGGNEKIGVCDAPPPCDAEDCRAYVACADAPRGRGCALEGGVQGFEWIGPGLLQAAVSVRLRGLASVAGQRCVLDGFASGVRLVAEVAHRLDPPALDLDLVRTQLGDVKVAGQGCPPEVLALIKEAVRDALHEAVHAELGAALRGLGMTCDPELPAP